MTLTARLLSAVALALPLLAAPAFSQTPQPLVTPVNSLQTPQGFEAFVPRPTRRTKLDYSVWDEALDDMVLDLGPSLRRRAGRPAAQTGTRLVRGHTSAYRLEGSRFTFAYVNDTFEEGLRDYREDLEQIGTEYDIASLPRNEQLAYWINLHNVALIEKISEAYPVRRPSRIKLDVRGQKVVLDEAKFITVKGVPLSLEDIRTRIVYPNWKDDPKVMYGFFRGDIGGPRLAKYAFTGDAVDYMLKENAEEFVNSLRGFDLSRSARNVSEVYEETQPFFFPSLERDLIAHMRVYARPEVAQELAQGKPIKFANYEDDVADLSGGNGIGASALNTSSTNVRGGGPLSYEALQLLRETEDKYRTLIREGLVGNNGGEVIIEDITTEDLAPDPEFSPLLDQGDE